MRRDGGYRQTAGILVCLLLVTAPAFAAEDSARDLVSAVLNAIPKASFTAKLRLSSASFETRELEMSRKIVGDAHGSYLEVAAPSMLEGIRFLFLERPGGPSAQYIKVAASRTSVRVSDEVRRQPFLGSTFYVSDLVMPEIDRFTYAFAGETELLGRKCRLVEMEPKAPAEEVYPRTVLALDPSDRIILRREFFDRDDKLFKVWTIDKVEKIDGFWTLTGQEMANVQDGGKSRLDIAHITYNVDLPDRMFTPKYLLR
jgi:hypothetical protein